jgi:hypothetical protein
MAERRTTPRLPFLIECSWTRDARITDLSDRGCYVETRVVPPIGERVEFSTTIDGFPTTLRGRVVSTRYGLGFGMRFVDLAEETGILIREALRKSQPPDER